MPTQNKPMNARGQGKYIDKLDKYSKDSKSKSVGNYMRTFSRTKTSQFITSWDDPNYLLIVNNYLKFIADDSGGVDTSTIGQTGILSLLDILWELYFENANLKDLVANDEAAWKLYFCAYLQIAFEIQIQYNMRCLLPAYTESDSVPGDVDHISYLTQSSYDIFVASMKEYPAPKGVDHLVKLIAAWVIQISQGYEKYTVRIPEGYVCPFNSRYDLEDLQAMRALLRVNLGGFTTHAKKYGLGVGSWSDPVKPTIKQWGDPDVTAYLNHSHFMFYDNQPAQQEVQPDGGYAGNNLTTEYTNVEFFFKENPNESELHVLAPIFGTYNGTNNIYGGWIIEGLAAAAEYKVNMLTVAQHGTSMATCSLLDKNAHMLLAHSKAYDDGTAATFQVFNNGTNFTAEQHIGGAWKYASDHHLLMGSGRGATETNNDLLNYLGKLIR